MLMYFYLQKLFLLLSLQLLLPSLVLLLTVFSRFGEDLSTLYCGLMISDHYGSPILTIACGAFLKKYDRHFKLDYLTPPTPSLSTTLLIRLPSRSADPLTNLPQHSEIFGTVYANS